MHRLGKGIRHFKETEEGRDHMSEAVERYANKKAKESSIIHVKSLMDTMKLNVDQALDALKITEQKERQSIIKAVQRGC